MGFPSQKLDPDSDYAAVKPIIPRSPATGMARASGAMALRPAGGPLRATALFPAALYVASSSLEFWLPLFEEDVDRMRLYR